MFAKRHSLQFRYDYALALTELAGKLFCEKKSYDEVVDKLVAECRQEFQKRISGRYTDIILRISPIEATLCHQPFLLSPQEGSSVFINSPESFEIPADVIVMGMENAENFMQIRKQKYLFDVLSLGGGNVSLYDQQYEKIKNIDVVDVRFQFLVDMIHRYQKGYEQEGYIRQE